MNFLETVGLVGRFAETAIFEDGETFFTDPAMSFFAKVKSETPNKAEIGIYENISNFLRVSSLFETPEIELEGEVIKIHETSENHTGSAKFVTSDIRLIRNLQTMDIRRAVEQTIQVEPTLRVEVDRTIISRIKSAVSAIPNSKVVIHSRNGEIEFIVKDVDVLMSTSNAYRFKVQGTSTKDCSVTLDAGFFSKMPGSFELSLAFSEKASTFRAILKDENLVVVIPTAHTAV